MQGHKRGKRRKNQFHFDMGKELYRVLGTDLTVVPRVECADGAYAGDGDRNRFRSFSQCGGVHQLADAVSREQEEWGQGSLFGTGENSNSRLAAALRLAAQTLHKSHSYLGAYYRRMRARLGAPQAITAAAHKLARIVYHLITTRTAYDESIFALEEQKLALRNQHRLHKQARALGFQLVPLPQPEVVH